ncbi:uncharacterized protein LOC135384818 [Ornithodoros turicata]|uniref:uncharacterized protein LOC135384818 n=1 Tax=Ornithodoros turicata TaxID=34597 RepID=UPI003139343B
MDPRSKRKKGSYCCVVGCHNNRADARGKQPAIKFYSFPNKWYEQERRRRWITAVRRVNEDGTDWEPSPTSVICSSHFVGNEKAVDEAHPAYVPTVFPEVYKKKLARPVDGTQTEATSQCDVGTFSVLMCTILDNARGTQVSHSSCTESAVQATPHTKSSSTGPDNRVCIFQGYESVCDDAATVQELCGISLQGFALLLSLLTSLRVKSVSITVPNELLMFLMKLKLGLSFSSLGTLFGVHRSTASRVFFLVLANLVTATRDWTFPPSLSTVRATMPHCFKEHYHACRYIIDCTEVRTETPAPVEKQRSLYSNYKGGMTVKFLVDIVPNGQIAFISKAYGGRESDTTITVQCGFLDLVEPGDLILADKGFPGINAHLGLKDAILVMPPFSSGNAQFSSQEMDHTYQIAQVRVHVERAIQRLKVFNIINQRVPIDLVPHMTDIVRMCAVLVNLQAQILGHQNDLYSLCTEHLVYCVMNAVFHKAVSAPECD